MFGLLSLTCETENLHGNSPGQISNSLPCNLNLINQVFAKELPASPRNLHSGELLLPQPCTPVWNESSVGRTGDGIFVNACLRREISRNKVRVLARRRRNYSEALELFDFIEVWLQGSHASLILEVIYGGDMMSMIFPRREGAVYSGVDEIAAALGAMPTEVFKARDIMANRL